MVVAHRYDKDIFDFLLSEANVDLNQKDLGGNTVLDKAKLIEDDRYPETALKAKGATGKIVNICILLLRLYHDHSLIFRGHEQQGARQGSRGR